MKQILLFCLGLVVLQTTAQKITKVEYFINQDPGFGKGQLVSGITANANLEKQAVSFNISSAPIGMNTLYVRSQDENGKWSLTNSVVFAKLETSVLPKIAKMEYFINQDPGFGKGQMVSGITPSVDLVKQTVSFNISSAPLGMNTLYLRSQDENGKWSLTNTVVFAKLESSVLPNIVAIEYFIDQDPGFGKGTSVTISPSNNVVDKSFTIDLASVSTGDHLLYLRSKDSNGKWSLTNIKAFKKSVVSGVETIEEMSILKIYPNPASEFLIIENGNFGIMAGYSVQVLNAQGQTVFSSAINQAQFNINLSNWAKSSLYVVKLFNAQNAVIETKKVVLQ